MSIWATAEPTIARPRSISGAVSLRPHHVLCAIGWQGHGYSPDFTRNMDAIVCDRLRAEPQTAVTFTWGADAICGPCPSRRDDSCVSAARIWGLDRRHADALGLEGGETMTWAEAEGRATSRLRPRDLDYLCHDCRWLALGICGAALARLQAG